MLPKEIQEKYESLSYLKYCTIQPLKKMIEDAKIFNLQSEEIEYKLCQLEDTYKYYLSNLIYPKISMINPYSTEELTAVKKLQKLAEIKLTCISLSIDCCELDNEMIECYGILVKYL